MNVRELKDMLENFDDDALVIVATSSDETYGEADVVVSGYYFAEDNWNGDFVDADTAEDDNDIDTEEAVLAILIE